MHITSCQTRQAFANHRERGCPPSSLERRWNADPALMYKAAARSPPPTHARDQSNSTNMYCSNADERTGGEVSQIIKSSAPLPSLRHCYWHRNAPGIRCLLGGFDMAIRRIVASVFPSSDGARFSSGGRNSQSHPRLFHRFAIARAVEMIRTWPRKRPRSGLRLQLSA